MDVAGILERLKHQGVAVTVNGDRIKLVPGSMVPPDIASALKEHKSEFLDFLLSKQVEEYAHAEFGFGWPPAQVEAAEAVNEGFNITDPDHRRYNVVAWVRGYYQDREENHGEQYAALKREQQRLGRILAHKGIG